MTEAEVRKLLESAEAQEHLGRNWSVVRKIGSGAFGSVFEIQKTDFGTISSAALKVVAVPSEETRNSYRMSMSEKDYRDFCESLRANLSDEHDKLKSLEGNANIVAYQGHCFVENGDGWAMLLKMEMLEGVLQHVKASGITRQEVIKLGIHICKALELCHSAEHKLIHRDIKPDNIFVSKYGDYKLGDFGVSKNMAATLSIMSRQGNAMFMAPEVYKNQGLYGYTVDIYSLGLVMYQYMNNNRPPFGGSGKFTRELPTESLERRMSGERLPYPENEDGALAKIVLKACSYRPEDRYESAADMRAALEALVDITDSKVYLEAGGMPPVANIRIRFFKDNNSPISEEMYFKGEKISVPPAPDSFEQDGYHYTFKGWMPEVRSIASADMDYYPTFKKEKVVTIRFLDDDQRVVSKKRYHQGEKIQVPEAPIHAPKNGIKRLFTGWSPAVKETAEEDADYTATYEMVAAESSKKWLILGGSIVIAAICLLLCVVLLITNREGSTLVNTPNNMLDNKKPVITETTDVKEYTVSEMEKLLEAVSWSDWASELPSGITTTDYVIQKRIMYSRAVAQHCDISKTLDPKLSTICYTYTDYPDEWSLWQVEPVAASSTRIVETRSIYSYKDGKQRKTVNAQGVTKTSLVWSKEWTLSGADGTEPIAETKTRQVKVEQQYRYKDLKEQVCYSTNWSKWQTNIIQPNKYINVRIKTTYRYAPKPDGVISAGMKNFVQDFSNYSGSFVDVADNKWYGGQNSTCIQHAAEIGALSPTEFLCFRPEENLTVGEAIQAAVVIHRIYYGELGELRPHKNAYLDYAKEQGIFDAQQYTNRLDQPATRREVAYLLWKALPQEELSKLNYVSKITDMNSGTEYYNAVYQLAQAGVISWPEAEYAFDPSRNTTRAEAAAMIERLIYPETRVSAN